MDIDLEELESFTSHLSANYRRGMNPYCPHIPTDKQEEFLNIPDLEAMYGGAAGGGKSDALLMGALQDVDKPGFSGLLLRRTFRDLNQPKAIMNRCHQWLRGTDAIWSAQDKRYTFPKSGATLTFGYCDNIRDLDQYASAEFHYIGWDELTQFPERWYTWMFSRLRREKYSKIRTRVRSATNPGNVGHVWVKRRFVDKATAVGRFTAARIEDNPHIDQDSYRQSLSKLDRITRNQLERGLWEQDSSLLVYHLDQAKNVILTAPECKYKVLGIDYGLVNDECSWTIEGWRDRDSKVYILQSWKKEHIVPGEAAQITQELNDVHKFERIVGDAGGLGRAYTEEARKRWAIPVEHAEKTNKRGYISLFNGELETGNIQIVESGCLQLIDEMLELPWQDENRMKECDGFSNHCTDGALYGWRTCRAYSAGLNIEKPLALPTTFSKW